VSDFDNTAHNIISLRPYERTLGANPRHPLRRRTIRLFGLRFSQQIRLFTVGVLDVNTGPNLFVPSLKESMCSKPVISLILFDTDYFLFPALATLHGLHKWSTLFSIQVYVGSRKVQDQKTRIHLNTLARAELAHLSCREAAELAHLETFEEAEMAQGSLVRTSLGHPL
jgi:hypothetical protein